MTEPARAEGLAPRQLASARRALSTRGFIVLQRVLAPDLVDALRAAFLARYGAMTADEMQTEVETGLPSPIILTGDRRYDVTLRMTAPFDDATVYANAAVLSVATAALAEPHLTSLSVVVSHPGAELQRIHRDSPYLFGPRARDLPAHALSVAMPLVDLDEVNGGTAVWAGSHRWPEGRKARLADARVPLLRRGDCLVYDYRTIHAGLPNLGASLRPVLFLVYARPWFFDEGNHRGRNPVDMPAEILTRAPAYTRALLTRARTALRGPPHPRRTPPAKRRGSP